MSITLVTERAVRSMKATSPSIGWAQGWSSSWSCRNPMARHIRRPTSSGSSYTPAESGTARTAFGSMRGAARASSHRWSALRMSSTISNSLSMIGGWPSRGGSISRLDTTERESVETTVSHERPVARSSSTARKRRSAGPPDEHLVLGRLLGGEEGVADGLRQQPGLYQHLADRADLGLGRHGQRGRSALGRRHLVLLGSVALLAGGVAPKPGGGNRGPATDEAASGGAQPVDDRFGPEPVTRFVGVVAILGVEPLPVPAEGRARFVRRCRRRRRRRPGRCGGLRRPGTGPATPRTPGGVGRAGGIAPPMSGTPSNTAVVPSGSPRTSSR